MSEAAFAFIKLIDSGALTLNAPEGKIGILAMQDCAALTPLLGAYQPHIWCPFYPWAKTLSQNFQTALSSSLPFADKLECILVFPSKQKDESAYMIAAALASAAGGAQIFIAAANDSGGNRIKKTAEEFGGTVKATESKNKCKIVELHCTLDALDHSAINAVINSGAPTPILDGRFMSQLGLYGWQKADQGSLLLEQYMPDDLHGLGADFGCGYGYLTRAILAKNPKIRKLFAIDAERRAIDLIPQNVAGHDSALHPLWDDLSAPDHLPKNLDFVIMNPPFHSGKSTECSLGERFIQMAHMSLKRYGRLYMVANTHLPYERTLDKLFHKFEVLAQANGFKVICAGK